MGRRFALLLTMICLTAGSAGAKPIDPTSSSVPCGINLVGTTAGIADALGQFTIVVRDLEGNPLAGTVVTIDLSACTPDIRLCSAQSAAGESVDCAAGVIHATTGGDGQVTLRILGGANNVAGHAPGAGFDCAKVFGNNGHGEEFLGMVNVGAFDEDGAGGVGPLDISLWLSDAFPTTYVGRSDFNCSHKIDPVDLSLLLQVSLGGGSHQSCSQYCH